MLRDTKKGRALHVRRREHLYEAHGSFPNKAQQANEGCNRRELNQSQIVFSPESSCAVATPGTRRVDALELMMLTVGQDPIAMASPPSLLVAGAGSSLEQALELPELRMSPNPSHRSLRWLRLLSAARRRRVEGT